MKNKSGTLFLLPILLLLLNITTISAASYTFSFPDYTQSVGSMRWTPINQIVSSGQYPYVYPDYSSIQTFYFLTPYQNSTIQATNIISCSLHQAIFFTWRTGYGGIGNAYYLAGYPDANVYQRPPYNISGFWTVN